jgi:tripartite-type tricarboxylate transporter receptor subunit TctC
LKPLRTFIGAALLAMAAAGASAQSGDTGKLVRLVVPFPPGNAADLQARALGEHIRKAGQTVIVENRPGASGAIAFDYVARAPADGNTLLVASLSPIVITPAVNKSLPYNVERDFSPVALLGFNDVVLLSGMKFPGSSVSDLVNMAKAKPGELSYASIGQGTLAHMVMEQISARAALQLLHVPFKGSSQAYINLFSGDVTVMLDGMPQSLPQVQAGRLKALAILSKARSPFAPEIPTVAESGIASLRNVTVVGWTGVLVRAGTPREVIERLNAQTMQILADPEMRTFMANQRLQIYPPHSPDDFAQLIRKELEDWREVARLAKIEAVQ